MAIREDDFNLGYSEPFNVGAENIRMDVDITTHSETGQYSISGIVKDINNAPIASAAVTALFDSDKQPAAATETNELGEYTLMVYPDTYDISAVKDGYVVSNRIEVYVGEDAPAIQDIALTVDPYANKKTLYGIVKTTAGATISEVIVSVFNGNDELIAVSHTAVDGEYVIENMVAGTYRISYTKAGYLAKNIDTTITTVDKMQNTTLSIDPNAGTKTITGWINEAGTEFIVPEAWVGLYQVVAGVESLLQVTYANSEGMYMFSKVATGTGYKVKAKSSYTE